MKGIVYIFILMSFSIMLLTGCVSSDGEGDDELSFLEQTIGIDKENIQAFLIRSIDQNPIKALSIADNFYDKELIDESQFLEYESQSIVAIKKTIRQYYLSKEYEKVLVYLDSLSLYQQYQQTQERSIEVPPPPKTTSGTTSKTTIVEEDGGDADFLDRTIVLNRAITQAHQNNNYPLAQKHAHMMVEYYPRDFFNLEASAVIAEEFQVYQDKELKDAICAIKKDSEFLCNEKEAPNNVDNLLRNAFAVDVDLGFTPRGISHELGSAFFITKNGYALTNYHVIQHVVDKDYEGKADLYVKLSQEQYNPRSAKVISYDPLIDLALIKVDDVHIERPLVLSPEEINEGDEVTVVGSPVGLVNTVTSGILSSKRQGEANLGSDLGTLYQIDASVNQGNSGGPLLNTHLDVAGVVVSKLEGLENLNFAIPSTIVKEVLPLLFQGGKITHNWLGIGGFPVDEGLEVLYIAPNTAVSQSALRKGDIITEIDGVPIKGVNNFQTIMLGLPPNKFLEVSFLRKQDDGALVPHKVLIATSEREQEVLSDAVLSKENFHFIFPILAGADIEVVQYSKHSPQYRITKVYPNTLASFIGFTKGDLIRIRKIAYGEQTIALLVRVLQQSRGFLDDVFELRLVKTTQNFL